MTSSRGLFVLGSAVVGALLLAFGCAGSDDAGVADGAPDGGTVDSSAAPVDAGADVANDDAASTPSCTPTTRYPAGTTLGTVGGRTFRVHVPPAGGAGKAAVLMLHGGGGSGEQFETASSAMDPVADREGFVTVYPDGTGVIKTWNAGNCCGRAVTDNVDDIAFLNTLLDHLETELCIDPHRLYAAGMSNGGLLGHRIACEMSARIAAVAPVAGTIGVTACAPARAIPVLHTHGTADTHVPYDGGVGCGSEMADFVSVPATMEGWRTRNGCAATTTPYFAQGNGSCVAFDGCRAPTVLCTVAGGGHSWPGGAPKGDGLQGCPSDGPQSTTFSASETAWAFFAANPLP